MYAKKKINNDDKIITLRYTRYNISKFCSNQNKIDFKKNSYPNKLLRKKTPTTQHFFGI